MNVSEEVLFNTIEQEKNKSKYKNNKKKNFEKPLELVERNSSIGKPDLEIAF
ncbi:MAG: hypothetical protein ACJ0NO_05205 [Flavobacteriaceae bacterium]